MKKLAIFLLLLISFTFSASASYISLKTTVTSRVLNSILEVSISAKNEGDEAAYGVQAEVRVGERKSLLNKVERLGINQFYRAQASFKLDHKNPGQYPLTVTLYYADANQYPFSALTCQTFSNKAEALPLDIFGRMRSATFWEAGKIKLALKNMGKTEMAVSTYLVVPRELTVDEEAYRLKIPAMSDRQLSFGVKNFSALSGSTYQVFAISEYEKNGIHLTSITPGFIKIVQSRTFLGIDYIYLAGILAVLVVVFMVVQFRRSVFKK
jgi:hypothetical protein